MESKAGSIHRRPVRANARNSLAWVALKGRETKDVRSRRQEVTEAEEALLRAIGKRVAGPRFMMNLDADPKTLELVDDLVAKGLVEPAGYVLRPGRLVRVRLTGRGWARYNEQRKQSDPLTDNRV